MKTRPYKIHCRRQGARWLWMLLERLSSGMITSGTAQTKEAAQAAAANKMRELLE